MILGRGWGLRGLENAVGRGGAEGTLPPVGCGEEDRCASQQGALLHMGPACIANKNAHPSVCRHVFLGVCA